MGSLLGTIYSKDLGQCNALMGTIPDTIGNLRALTALVRMGVVTNAWLGGRSMGRGPARHAIALTGTIRLQLPPLHGGATGLSTTLRRLTPL